MSEIHTQQENWNGKAGHCCPSMNCGMWAPSPLFSFQQSTLALAFKTPKQLRDSQEHTPHQCRRGKGSTGYSLLPPSQLFAGSLLQELYANARRAWGEQSLTWGTLPMYPHDSGWNSWSPTSACFNIVKKAASISEVRALRSPKCWADVSQGFRV